MLIGSWVDSESDFYHPLKKWGFHIKDGEQRSAFIHETTNQTHEYNAKIYGEAWICWLIFCTMSLISMLLLFEY